MLSSDVVCLLAPVAAGKTKLLEAATLWSVSQGAKSAAIGPPTNALVDQYGRSLSPSAARWVFARRKSLWTCQERADDGRDDTSCEARAKEIGAHCKGRCPYVRSLRAMRARGSIVVGNWQLIVAHKLRPDFLAVDEAHGLPDFLAEMRSKVLWRHQWKWPRTFDSLESVAAWLQKEASRAGGPHPALRPFLDALEGKAQGVSLRWGEGEWRGRPEEFLRAEPLDVRDAPANPLWRPDTKLLLASATLSEEDVEAMGLHRKRVAWVRLPSEIPVERRPLYWWPAVDGRYGKWTPAEMAAAVAAVLEHYRGQRGVVHATYGLARQLETAASDPASPLHTHRARLRFHGDAAAKAAALDAFLAPDPRGPAWPDDRVLVLSGQYEGLDLAGPLARFQVLTQWPRPSLADPGMRWLVERRPRAYRWRSIRDGAQAYGRVCRGPLDEGDTVLLDASADEVLSADAPDWLREAVVRVPLE